ncbi:uncharacterized protein [Palaemon carinicauda]|uniref:uncharacterized protein n=1 Tax=Palaemon carinicauda TaxID=392227 RepID=UPI0035B5D693
MRSAMGNVVYLVVFITLFVRYGCMASVLTHRDVSGALKYNNRCNELGNGFLCGDCKTLVTCIDGEAYAEVCRTGDTCRMTPTFGNAVCQPVQHEYCICNRANEFFADAYDPQAFFYCNDIQSEPVMHHCPENNEFDDQKQQCINVNGLPDCTTDGFFPLYRNCSQYYSCTATRDGWIQKSYSCNNGAMYNEDTGHCEEPCSWLSRSFTCRSEGRFPDPLSCQNYYECVQLQNSGFRQYLRQCPHGYMWKHDDQFRGGQCVKQTKIDCSPVKINRCVTSEWHCLTDFNNQELEEQIKSLELKKLEKEHEIQEVTVLREALRSTGKMVGEVFRIMEKIPRERELVQDSYPNININVDVNGTVTVSPYCNIQEKDAIKGSGTEVILLALEDVRKTVTQSLDLLPCMKDVMGILVNSLYDGEFVISIPSTDLGESLINTIQMIKRKFDEIDNAHEKLVSERDEIESEVMRLKAHLETNTENPA